mmetsp:Transcript_1119/g.7210  ORF Transcript_1119/g.7210 Transcript_1119/m.7210 type:complete len:144 (-) Transcript_1119:1665-2096(-)
MIGTKDSGGNDADLERGSSSTHACGRWTDLKHLHWPKKAWLGSTGWKIPFTHSRGPSQGRVAGTEQGPATKMYRSHDLTGKARTRERLCPRQWQITCAGAVLRTGPGKVAGQTHMVERKTTMATNDEACSVVCMGFCKVVASR